MDILMHEFNDVWHIMFSLAMKLNRIVQTLSSNSRTWYQIHCINEAYLFNISKEKGKINCLVILNKFKMCSTILIQFWFDNIELI